MIDLAEAMRRRAESSDELNRQDMEELRAMTPQQSLRILEMLLPLGFDLISRAIREERARGGDPESLARLLRGEERR